MNTSTPIDWTEEPDLDPKLEYEALCRSLRRSQGFSLVFVLCSSHQEAQIIEHIQEDVNKRLAVLQLTEPVRAVYDLLNGLATRTEAEWLIVCGLEKSIISYESERSGWTETELFSRDFPPVIGHLNMQRERFQSDLKKGLLFLCPEQLYLYLLRRSPDFFDWRSGVMDLRTWKGKH